MSEQEKGSAQSDVVGDNAEDQAEKVDKVSYDTHRKLLGEKKKLQQEYEAMRAELEKKSQAEMEQKGEEKKLIEALRKQLAEKDKSLMEVKTNYTFKSLESHLIAEGTKQGCQDMELLLKSIDMNAIEINDDFTVNQEDLKRAVSEIAQKKPILFKKKVGEVKDGIPAVNKDDLNGKVDLSKLTLQEKIKKMAEMSAQGQFAKRKG